MKVKIIVNENKQRSNIRNTSDMQIYNLLFGGINIFEVEDSLLTPQCGYRIKIFIAYIFLRQRTLYPLHDVERGVLPGDLNSKRHVTRNWEQLLA